MSGDHLGPCWRSPGLRNRADKCPAFPLIVLGWLCPVLPPSVLPGLSMPLYRGTLPARLGQPLVTKFPAHLIPDPVLGFPISWSSLPLPKSPVGFRGAGLAWWRSWSDEGGRKGVGVPETPGKESLSVTQNKIQSHSLGPTFAFPGDLLDWATSQFLSDVCFQTSTQTSRKEIRGGRQEQSRRINQTLMGEQGTQTPP